MIETVSSLPPYKYVYLLAQVSTNQSINFLEIVPLAGIFWGMFSGAYQLASSSSLLSIMISPETCCAVNPTISEFGNGQDMLPKYLMSDIEIPTSSATSLRKHSSRVSPASTNPAKTL